MALAKSKERPMKYVKTLSMLFLTSILIITPGCKDNAAGPNDGLADDDAADLVAGIMGGRQSTGGLTAQFSDAARLAGGAQLSKTGVALADPDTVFLVRDTTTTFYSYYYAMAYIYSFPSVSRMQVTYIMKGGFDTPRATANDSAGGVWTITNVTPPATEYRIDGASYRIGSLTLKLRDKTAMTHQMRLTLSGISVDKSTGTIKSGICTFTISGQTDTGTSFTKNGTITFGTGGAPSLTIGTKKYLLDIVLGEATPA
jgi:hypothetical protein